METLPTFSLRARDLHASPVRELLALIDRPGMISFAGGLPALETFTPPDLRDLPVSWLQYGPSEGEPALRARIAAELGACGLSCDPGQIIVLSGSQQGIDLVAKLFIDPGTPVWTQSPTYVAALQAFRFFGARFVTDGGPAGEAGAGERPVLAYVIPTFQNPTGACWSGAQRESFARRCDASGTVVFEDDPYRDLAYDACERTPVCARLRRCSWIYQGSFSKTLAPGLRLGFLAASPDLVAPLARLKQAADLHSCRVSQWLVLRHLEDPGRSSRLQDVVGSYRRKRDAFAGVLGRRLQGLATWEVPAGGLFFWLRLARPLDTRALLPRTIERGVAFMPGESFYPDARPPGGTLRLNFSHASTQQAEDGLAVLARALQDSA